MSAAFDPFFEWFLVPPNERPPSHYKMLNLEPFEADPKKIDAQARLVLGFLQEQLTSPHAREAQQMIAYVERVRQELLNPARKAAYDASLRGPNPFAAPTPAAAPAASPFSAPAPRPQSAPVVAPNPFAAPAAYAPSAPVAPNAGYAPFAAAPGAAPASAGYALAAPAPTVARPAVGSYGAPAAAPANPYARPNPYEAAPNPYGVPDSGPGGGFGSLPAADLPTSQGLPSVPNPYAAPKPTGASKKKRRRAGANSGEMAGRFQRLAAHILESLVYGAVGFVLGLVALGISGGNKEAAGKTLAVLQMCVVLPLALYELVLLCTAGQNFGKSIVGIQIVDADGVPGGFFRCVVMRGIVPVAILIGAIYMTGPGAALLVLFNVLWIFGAERRCLHDYVAGTYVRVVDQS